jgi:hypothetical protein
MVAIYDGLADQPERRAALERDFLGCVAIEQVSEDILSVNSTISINGTLAPSRYSSLTAMSAVKPGAATCGASRNTRTPRLRRASVRKDARQCGG